jgi:Short C-terminal domain
MPEAKATVADHGLPRGRRYAIRALLVVATCLLVVGSFAVWANRQLLNADHWAETSSQLLENDAVRAQVSGLVVDQLYANVDVAGQLQAAFPKRLKPLAATAAGGLRNLAQEATDRALDRPRVQELWTATNRITAQQFINIAKGDSKVVTGSGNAVVLDVRPLMLDIGGRLGLPGSVLDKVPPDAGHVKVIEADQVGALRDGAAALQGLALVLPVLGFLLLALAVYLARGRRRHTLMWVGIDLILAGAVVLVARNLVGSSVVDSLAKTEAARPAAEAVWSIGTRILRDIGQAVIITGLPVLFAAWLAGGTRPAVAARRVMAPWLNDRPAVAYGAVGALLCLVVLWAPIPATRKVIPVLVMIGLAALGVHALRRQTAEEFPDAHAGGGVGVAARLTRRAATGRGPAAGNGSPPADPRLERLERLSDLHDRGALSDQEYAAEKATVLGA